MTGLSASGCFVIEAKEEKARAKELEREKEREQEKEMLAIKEKIKEFKQHKKDIKKGKDHTSPLANNTASDGSNNSSPRTLLDIPHHASDDSLSDSSDHSVGSRKSKRTSLAELPALVKKKLSQAHSFTSDGPLFPLGQHRGTWSKASSIEKRRKSLTDPELTSDDSESLSSTNPPTLIECPSISIDLAPPATTSPPTTVTTTPTTSSTPMSISPASNPSSPTSTASSCTPPSSVESMAADMEVSQETMTKAAICKRMMETFYETIDECHRSGQTYNPLIERRRSHELAANIKRTIATAEIDHRRAFSTSSVPNDLRSLIQSEVVRNAIAEAAQAPPSKTSNITDKFLPSFDGGKLKRILPKGFQQIPIPSFQLLPRKKKDQELKKNIEDILKSLDTDSTTINTTGDQNDSDLDAPSPTFTSEKGDITRSVENNDYKLGVKVVDTLESYL
eukprot:gene66-89_t